MWCLENKEIVSKWQVKEYNKPVYNCTFSLNSAILDLFFGGSEDAGRIEREVLYLFFMGSEDAGRILGSVMYPGWVFPLWFL